MTCSRACSRMVIFKRGNRSGSRDVLERPNILEIPIGVFFIPSDVARAFPVPHGMGHSVNRCSGVTKWFSGSELRRSKMTVSPPKTTMMFSFKLEISMPLKYDLWLVLENVLWPEKGMLNLLKRGSKRFEKADSANPSPDFEEISTLISAFRKRSICVG